MAVLALASTASGAPLVAVTPGLCVGLRLVPFFPLVFVADLELRFRS